MTDDGLRDLLLQLSPAARDHLRTVLIRDDRDEIAQQLLRYGDANGDEWADVIDMLTMYTDARRNVVRLLAEIDAEASKPGRSQASHLLLVFRIWQGRHEVAGGAFARVEDFVLACAAPFRLSHCLANCSASLLSDFLRQLQEPGEIGHGCAERYPTPVG